MTLCAHQLKNTELKKKILQLVRIYSSIPHSHSSLLIWIMLIQDIVMTLAHFKNQHE